MLPGLLASHLGSDTPLCPESIQFRLCFPARSKHPLASISQPVMSDRLRIRIKGVLPIRAVTPSNTSLRLAKKMQILRCVPSICKEGEPPQLDGPLRYPHGNLCNVHSALKAVPLLNLNTPSSATHSDNTLYI